MTEPVITSSVIFLHLQVGHTENLMNVFLLRESKGSPLVSSDGSLERENGKGKIHY